MIRKSPKPTATESNARENPCAAIHRWNRVEDADPGELREPSPADDAVASGESLARSVMSEYETPPEGFDRHSTVPELAVMRSTANLQGGGSAPAVRQVRPPPWVEV